MPTESPPITKITQGKDENWSDFYDRISGSQQKRKRTQKTISRDSKGPRGKNDLQNQGLQERPTSASFAGSASPQGLVRQESIQNTGFCTRHGFMGPIHDDKPDDTEEHGTTSVGPTPEPAGKLRRTERMPLGATLEAREGERRKSTPTAENENDQRVFDANREFEDQEGELRIELGFSASVPTTPARRTRGGTVGTKAHHRIQRSGRGAKRLNSGEIVGEAINDEG